MDSSTDSMIPALREAYHRLPVDVGGGAEVRLAVRARRRRRAVLAAAAAVVVAGAGLAVVQGRPTNGDPGGGLRVLPQATSERWSSTGVADWLAHADAVVVAVVVDEHKGAQVSAGDGSGDSFVRRTVDLAVRQTLWTRPRADVPSRVTVGALGWTATDGSLRRTATSGSPRLEVGRTYLIALRSERCAPSDGGTAAASDWVPLGSEAIWPVTADRIGYGESEGRSVEGDRSQATIGSFESEMIGKSPAAVEQALATSWAREDTRSRRTC